MILCFGYLNTVLFIIPVKTYANRIEKAFTFFVDIYIEVRCIAALYRRLIWTLI